MWTNFQKFSHHEFCSVLFLSRPRSEGWPHHGRTFSIYLRPLSFWLTLPQRVLSRTWCCLSRPCVVFLACVHLALFLALFLSPVNSLVSSWCDHSMLASSLWQCLTVPSLLQLCWEPTHLFSLLSTKHAESFSVLSSQRPQDVFHSSAFISLIFVEIGMLWLFHIFCSDAPIACPLLNLARDSAVNLQWSCVCVLPCEIFGMFFWLGCQWPRTFVAFVFCGL